MSRKTQARFQTETVVGGTRVKGQGTDYVTTRSHHKRHPSFLRRTWNHFWGPERNKLVLGVALPIALALIAVSEVRGLPAANQSTGWRVLAYWGFGAFTAALAAILYVRIRDGAFIERDPAKLARNRRRTQTSAAFTTLLAMLAVVVIRQGSPLVRIGGASALSGFLLPLMVLILVTYYVRHKPQPVGPLAT